LGQLIHDGLSRFAGRALSLNDDVYASATATNFRNQSTARLLQSDERICLDPAEATVSKAGARLVRLEARSVIVHEVSRAARYATNKDRGGKGKHVAA
jgi:glutaminase